MIKRFRKMSMTSKMTVTLVIPLTIISGVLFAVFFPMINRQYSERVFRNVAQSVDQAGAFLNEYVMSMQYRLEKLCNDQELINLLSGEEFGRQTGGDTSFREFYKLENILMQNQVMDNRYQMAIYLPDELSYAENRFYIYPESDFTSLPDHEQLLSRIGQNQTAVTIGTHKNTANASAPFEALIMFQRIYSNAGEPLAVARTSISTSELIKILSAANITDTGIMLLLDQDNRILLHSGDDDGIDLEDLIKEWEESGEPDSLHEMEYKGSRYYTDVSDFRFRLVSMIPVEEVNRQVRVVQNAFILLGTLLILTTLLLSAVVVHTYVTRLSRLNEKMVDIENGEINTRFDLESIGDTRDEIEHIYYNFNYMAERVRTLLHEHYIMGKNVQAAELRALQAQINPHFLYNTLDLVNWMALDYDADEIADITRDLARFYRLSLNHGRNMLTIKEEIEHVESYVRIENVHFDGAITLTKDIPESILQFGCPNIILQPFVENSIVHGIAEHPEIVSCSINISAVQEDDDIIFTVADDGPGMNRAQITELLTKDYQESTKGYGVRNINFRLKLYFGEKYGINYDGTDSSGTVVHIRIPARTLEEMMKESEL